MVNKVLKMTLMAVMPREVITAAPTLSIVKPGTISLANQMMNPLSTKKNKPAVKTAKGSKMRLRIGQSRALSKPITATAAMATPGQ